MNDTASYFVLGHHVTPLPTLGDFGLVEIKSPPGVPGPPPHHHDDASEFFYVADGQLDVRIDGEWRTLHTGDSLSIAPGTVHTLRNTGDRECRWITGWSPRGFEAFFSRFGIDASDPAACVASTAAEVIGRVVAECGELGMVLAPE